MDERDQNPPDNSDRHEGNSCSTDELGVNPAPSPPAAKPEDSELNSRKLITELAALLEKSTKVLAELQRAPSGSKLAEMVERARTEFKSFELGNGQEACTILSDSNGHADLYAVVPMTAGMKLVLCSSLHHGDVFIVQPNEITIQPADHWEHQPVTDNNLFIMQGVYRGNMTNAFMPPHHRNTTSVAQRMVDLKLDKLAAMVDRATSNLQDWLAEPQLITYETTLTRKLGIFRHATILLQDNKELVVCAPQYVHFIAEDIYFIAEKDREKNELQTYSEWDYFEECRKLPPYSYILPMPKILYAGKYLEEKGFEPVAEFMRGDGEEHLQVMLVTAKEVLRNYITDDKEIRQTWLDKKGSTFLGASISMKYERLLTMCSSREHDDPYVLHYNTVDPGPIDTWSTQQPSGNYEFNQNIRNFWKIDEELRRVSSNRE